MKSDLLDSDENASREALEQAQANAQRTFIEDVKWVMSSPRGRRFVWWLLSLTGTRRSSFNNSGSVTAFNEGQRNVGLAVEAQVIENCHPNYLTMLEEQRTK
jgi:hypothetical protein